MLDSLLFDLLFGRCLLDVGLRERDLECVYACVVVVVAKMFAVVCVAVCVVAVKSAGEKIEICVVARAACVCMCV